MHKLMPTFLDTLKVGFLSEITKRVIKDRDLNLEIRENYLNIYYKGNSLLRLTEKSPQCYHPYVHPKILNGIQLPDFTDKASVDHFMRNIPAIKDNIVLLGKPSLEIEYEQMIIRANNQEPRNNSEYFIVDRQVTAGKAGRFDLTGLFWERNGRKRGQTVPLCLFEVKFALNQDIQDVDQQLKRYYLAIREKASELAEETEGIFRQKLELGLFRHPADRLEAMKTLKFSRDIDDFQFILILVDYNPYSSLYKLDRLAKLSFAGQIKIFRGGFAMWEKEFKSLAEANLSPVE